MSVQNQWRQCVNCLGAFFTGDTDPGTGGPDLGDCPATAGPHVPNTGFRLLAIRNQSRPGAQDGWRRCSKCQGMFHGLSPVGVCPEDHSTHLETDSETYAIGNGSFSRGAQPGWRYCQKCQGLWLSTGVGTGSCPAGGLHDKAGSSEYSLEFEQDFIAPLAATALSATSGDPGTRVVVSVRDGAGNPVKGLAGEHFRVFRENAQLTSGTVAEIDGLDGVYLIRLPFIPGSGFRGTNALSVKVMRDWQHDAIAMAPLVHVP